MRTSLSAASLLVFGLALASAPAPAAAARGGVPGDRAEGEAWAVRVAPAAVRPGEAATATVHVTARAGYHVTPEYPMSFRPGKDSTVTFKSPRLALTPASTTACVAEPEYTCALAVELPFTAPAQGDALLAGTLNFSVCSAERCLIEKVPLLVRLAAR